MTTTKQVNANQLNSQKSSGPKTPQGKAQSSTNACKHGVLSRRLFLDDEKPEEYQQLLDGLQGSLKPIGSLELTLVEKIAVCCWRQQRLVRAETASIELDRCLDRKSIRAEIEEAMGMTYPSKLDDAELTPPNEDEEALYEDACKVVSEYIVYIRRYAETISVDYLEKNAPYFYNELMWDVEQQGSSISEFLASYEGGLHKWIESIYALHCKTYVDVKQRKAVARVAERVKSLHSSPINHELISKYQTALDSELYRAIRALREAQEWRLQSTGSPA